jgi:type II secretion system protein J
MKQNKGFTLIELLIAVAISGFIIASTYEIVNSVIFSKNVIASQYLKSEVLHRINSIFNKDFRESVKDSYSYSEALDKKIFSFKTFNSLFFNNSLIVEVKYYVEEDLDNEKKYLVREENREDMNYNLKIRLLPDIKDFKMLFFNGSEYSENFPSSLKLFKITFKWNNVVYNIPVGKLE